MNVLPKTKQIRVIASLVNGNSIRATERIAGVNRETVMRLGVRVGEGCALLHDSLMCDVHVDALELDELWSFIGKKQSHRTAKDAPEVGDSYTFIGLDGISKAIVSYQTGRRDAETTNEFCVDLRKRIVNRPAIASDGFRSYIPAIDTTFGIDCDYAQVIKEYSAGGDTIPTERRYSPASVVSVEKTKIVGNPDMNAATTSHVERLNLTLRMNVRRFTRLTNAFSRKLRNHRAAVSLFVAYYNLCLVHSTTRVTPAMEIGVTDHVWSLEELLDAALAFETASSIPPAPQTPPEKPVLSRAAIDGPIRARGGIPKLRVIKGGLA